MRWGAATMRLVWLLVLETMTVWLAATVAVTPQGDDLWPVSGRNQASVAQNAT
jgi:hypothetical protein